MGLFGNLLSSILPNLGQVAGVGYEIYKDQHLTGAQREANQFSAEQASLNRGFQSQQAELAREWQEEQYLKYNSPAAMMSQYRDAGLNPALMYQQGTSPASMTTSAPSGDSAVSVAPSGGDIVGMLGRMMELSLLGEKKKELELKNEGQSLSNLITETYGFNKADKEVQLLEKTIDKTVSEIGETNTRSALNAAHSELLKAQKEGVSYENALKRWEADFIAKYHVSSALAGDLVRSLGSLAGDFVSKVFPTVLKRK